MTQWRRSLVSVVFSLLACSMAVSALGQQNGPPPPPPPPPPPVALVSPPPVAPATPVVPLTVEPAPAVFPATIDRNDSVGVVTTFQPNGPSVTQGDTFFAALGTNGRTCFTCHRPGYGWGFSAGHAQRTFADSNGTAPLFRVVDGAVCPTDDVSTPAAMQSAYRLLLNHGLIRIGLAVPANPQFTVAVSVDPDGCTGKPATGLTSPVSGTVNVYRRPLPTANLPFVTAIMWDGREPTLQHQALDASLTHEQSASGPTAAQQNQIVAFESGLFVAQSSDLEAGALNAGGATGGPVALSNLSFFAGINDSAGQGPQPFNPTIFSLYKAWASLTGTAASTLAQQSIARGEQIFNSKSFAITGVAGFNDVAGKPSIPGTCGTCHDTPNVGNHSVPAFLNIGVTAPNPPVLTVSQLPVFKLTCTIGPQAGSTFAVTDPGRAMITGNCADIGKTKIPTLRALASRAPYFHNGSAPTLLSTVRFYEKRFNFQLSPADETDLVSFMSAL